MKGLGLEQDSPFALRPPLLRTRGNVTLAQYTRVKSRAYAVRASHTP
jgi:hypothetical protein